MSSSSASQTTSSTQSATQPPSATSSSSNSIDGSSGISGYYFVFFAIILCILGFAAFTIVRRRKRLVSSRADDWTSATRGGARRHRPGNQTWRWRSAEASREEGLNEEGEAPPPYIPKSSEELQAAGTGAGDGTASHGPTVPMTTLSREAAGLKPPDYRETELPSAGLGSSSSRHPS